MDYLPKLLLHISARICTVPFDPPNRLSWYQPELKGPVATLDGNYLLESHGEGTRFTLRSTYEAPGLWRLITPYAKRQLEKNIFPTLLRQLKEALETT